MFTHALFFVLQAVINLVDASYLHRSNPRARGESEREREHGTLPYCNPPHLPKTRLLYAHTCLFVVLQGNRFWSGRARDCRENGRSSSATVCVSFSLVAEHSWFYRRFDSGGVPFLRQPAMAGSVADTLAHCFWARTGGGSASVGGGDEGSTRPTAATRFARIGGTSKFDLPQGCATQQGVGGGVSIAGHDQLRC